MALQLHKTSQHSSPYPAWLLVLFLILTISQGPAVKTWGVHADDAAAEGGAVSGGATSNGSDSNVTNTEDPTQSPIVMSDDESGVVKEIKAAITELANCSDCPITGYKSSNETIICKAANDFKACFEEKSCAGNLDKLAAAINNCPAHEHDGGDEDGKSHGNNLMASAVVMYATAFAIYAVMVALLGLSI